MTPSERERRIEAGMRAWLPLGSPLLGRRVVACILDAADEAVPMVSEAEVADRIHEAVMIAGVGDVAWQGRAERAEAAARDFAEELRNIADLKPGNRQARRWAAEALARHPSFSGEEGTEG